MKRSNPWLISALGILTALAAVIILIDLHLPDSRANVYATGGAALGTLRLLKPALPIAMQHTSSVLTSASVSAVSEAPDIFYEEQLYRICRGVVA